MIASSPIIVYLLLRVASADDDRAYCAVRYSRLCQEKGQHVGCQYPESGPGESCEKYTKIVFTDDLKNFILNYINRRRQKIAAGHERVRGGLPIPKPDIMMYVEWDRELAYLAQRLADQCRFVHDECRATVRYPYPGQTVGEVRWRRSQDSDQITAQKAIRKVFDAWWGEKRRVQPQQLTTPFRVTPKGTMWGHFSQLAIWKLRAIGCGAVHHGPLHPRLLLVCDYSHTNMLGQKTIGTMWGHFSQLAIWKLQAIGCGAVHHGPPHPRLLLVCDYSHTNMLGQKTISAGPLATCPPHTTRKIRSQYPLLCSTIKYSSKLQELDSLYDYESQDSREDKETFPEDIDKVVTTTDEAIYSERVQQDINENEVSGHRHRKVVTSEGLNNLMKTRNQIKIVYGRYEPPKSTTKRMMEAAEYDERKYIDRENDRNGGHYYQKRPNGEDYSVIPLRSRPWDLNDVGSPPWRPTVFWQTSTSVVPEYETSIVYIPVNKNRKFTVAESGIQDESIRRHHNENRRPHFQVKLREKDIKQFTTPANRKPLAPSLKLDKEDIDQLYKDTGFKPNWTPLA